MERTGIAVAGSILVDKINEIREYPRCGQLAQILRIEKAVGGCVPNVAVDLKKIRPGLPVWAIGKTGDDEEGAYVADVLKKAGVDIAGCMAAKGTKTSFTDVMSVAGGQRTFFAYPGASADFGYEDIRFEKLQAKLFHLGYFLLLQKIDDGDGIRILKRAQEEGMKTSIDLVSENSDRYALVLPCLAYTDYLIVNEEEAGKLAGIEPENENLVRIAKALLEKGVREKVIIHKPDRAVCVSKEGETTAGSYVLPEGYIRGTTGAGDAFCAGALLGICDGWSDRAILEFASSSAVMALGTAGATDGLVTEEEIRTFCSRFERRRV